MKCLTVAAQVEHLDAVQSFIRQELERYDCSARALFQIELAVEEIFVNIAGYAYHPGRGEAVICCEVEEAPLRITICFSDRGRPFDPLAWEDVDTSPEALERRVGGLGILLVKKNMDEVFYTYEDGKNILTVRKSL